MRARLLAAALLLAPVACAQSESLTVVLPFLDSDGAAFVFFERPNGATDIYAVPADEGTPIFEEGDDARITALFFADRLEDLRIAPGPYVRPEGSSRSLRLSDQTHGEVIAIEGGRAGSWEPTTELPSAVSDVKIPLLTTCVKLGIPTRPARIEGATFAGSLVRDGDGAWMILTINGEDLGLYWTDGHELVRTEVDLDGERPSALQRAGGGELWLGTSNIDNSGQLRRGHPDRTFELVPTGSFKRGISRIELPADADDPASVYIRDVYEGIHRISNGTSEQLVPWSTARHFGVLAEEDLLYIRRDQTGIERSDRGAVRAETIPDPDLYLEDPANPLRDRLKMSVLTHGPSVGSFAGNNEGQLLLRADGDWSVVGENILGSSIEAITPFGDGVMVGFFNGQVIQYSAASGWCEAEEFYASVGTNLEITGILPVSGGLLLCGLERAEADLTVPVAGFVMFLPYEE